MITLIKELREALKEARASERKAAGASAIERIDPEQGRIDRDIAELKRNVTDLQPEVAELKADVRLIKRMLLRLSLRAGDTTVGLNQPLQVIGLRPECRGLCKSCEQGTH